MNAAMEDNTVIITALNEAWVKPNSTFDVFRESFKAGIGTEILLKHVIAVCLDKHAYDRCIEVHPHCYLINVTDSDQLSGPNRFMTPGYLKLIWRRMDLLKEVLGLGYNFIFTVRVTLIFPLISYIISLYIYIIYIDPLKYEIFSIPIRYVFPPSAYFPNDFS